jgi:hypothetical protein
MKKKRRPRGGDPRPAKKGDKKQHHSSNEITEADQVRCVSVYNGRDHIGYLLAHRWNGIEALDVDRKSIGMYLDQQTATAALAKRAAS